MFDIHVGLEAIDYQGSKFGYKLAKEFEKIIKYGFEGNFNAAQYFRDKSTKSIIKDIDKMIEDEIGIKIRHYSTTMTWYACLPITNGNNNVLAESFKWTYDYVKNHETELKACESDDFDNECAEHQVMEKIISNVSNMRSALADKGIKVDRTNARIEGLPKDFELSVLVNFQALVKSGATGLQLAAILMHEVGHLFTHIEYMNRTTRSVTSLADKVRDMGKDKTTTQDDILTFVSKELDIEAPDSPNGLINLCMVAERFINKQTQELLVLDPYDGLAHRDSEYAADSFAAKFGLGEDLIDALAMLSKDRPGFFMEFIIAGMVAVIQNIFILLLIMLSGVGGVFTIFGIIFVIMYIFIKVITILIGEGLAPHGTSVKRAIRVANELKYVLKTSDLDKDTKKDIVKQIDVLRGLEDKLKHTDDSIAVGLKAIFFSSRTNNSIEMNERFEDLFSNELHLAASRLQILQGK